jgi:RimJ/RimL family protein N-acetyltransferase
VTVELREVREADIPILFAHQSDPEANAMAAFPARDEPAFREHLARVLADPANIIRAIVSGDRVVGQIGSWDDGDQRNVGYWIGREHWSNGYATEALRALLAIDATRPLWVHVAEHNVGSQRVAERCGFVFDHEVQEEDVVERVFRLDSGPSDM